MARGSTGTSTWTQPSTAVSTATRPAAPRRTTPLPPPVPTARKSTSSSRRDTIGKSFAPLAINGQTAESSRTALGIRAFYETQICGVAVRPEVKLAWQHEFGDSTYSITSSFASLGGNPFTVTGATIGRDSLLIGAGFSILWTPRFATYVYYDGEVCRTNYSSHNVSGGFRLQF
jgi:outer membrane autotransporter protein